MSIGTTVSPKPQRLTTQVGDPTSDMQDAIRRLYVVTEEGVQLTPLGTFLLEKMKAAPHRFMVGVDCDNTLAEHVFDDIDGDDGLDPGEEYSFGMDDYRDSVQNYRDFLELGDLTAAERDLILHANAEALFVAVDPDGVLTAGVEPAWEWLSGAAGPAGIDPGWVAERLGIDRSGAWKLRL